MLEKSFGLLFFLKQSKNAEGNKKYIYQRITVDGQPLEWSTKEQWDENRWDQVKGRASGSKQDAQEINFFLNSLQNKVFQARKLLIENEEKITAELLRDIVTGRRPQKMILEIFAHHNSQMGALVGKDFAGGTFDRYKTSLEHTRRFITQKYKAKDLSIRKLDHHFIEQYAFWLKTTRKCNHNTTMKYLANFKKIVLICVKNKWLPGDPFCNFKMTRKEVFRDPLDQLELDRIIFKDFENDRLDNVRDIFVFSCYTGLAYADVKKLERSEITTGTDGGQWINTARQKTDTPCSIPLLPAAAEILEKYAANAKCLNGGKALPVISNQKMNAYLKEIADTCGIRKALSFHLARHTFATTICLCNDVPIETVSKMLGHTTLKQTQHYAKVLHTKISNDMARLRNKLTRQLPPADSICEADLTETALVNKPVEQIQKDPKIKPALRKFSYVYKPS